VDRSELDVPPAVAGRRVALLVCGGIAVYKLVDLASRLVRAGCQVRVAMTRSAQQFVGPTSFRGITGHPVLTDLFGSEGPAEPHVELGDWAQLMLLAPATADVLARLVQGRSDDPVTATVLAARCPILIAPAMNDAMWNHAAVQANVAVLWERGLTVLAPEEGRLASGHRGPGRLPTAEAILTALEACAAPGRDYAGIKVVVTAGGTREPIDPVRFISNYSSGKMGYALARTAAQRGAEVVLISTVDHPWAEGVTVVAVVTAAEMLAGLRQHLGGARLLIMAAAVADYRPDQRVPDKIRREQQEELMMRLVRNPDLLAELSSEPDLSGLYRLGFAAEDSGLAVSALAKLQRKHLDAIVANDIRRSDIGFGSDYNEGLMLFADGQRLELPKMPKSEMAERILGAVRPRLG